MKKRMLAVGLVCSLIFSSSFSSAKSYTLTIKGKNLFASKVTQTNKDKTITYYTLEKQVTKVDGNSISSSSGYLKKGKTFYIFNKSLAVKINDKIRLSNKKVKVTYQKITKTSKYGKKVKSLKTDEFKIMETLGVVLTAMQSQDAEIKDLVEKSNNEKLSEDEQKEVILKLVNYMYEQANLHFDTYEDYDKYLDEKANDNLSDWLKNSYVVTKVK